MDEAQIILSNLTRLDGKAALLRERMLAHTGELAQLLGREFPCSEGDCPIYEDSFRSRYAELTKRPAVWEIQGIKENILEQNIIGLSCCSCADVISAKVCLCRLLVDLYGRTAVSNAVLRDNSDSAECADNKISYLKNYYTDISYETFARLLSEPTVSYADNFMDVCEEVYNGNARYCILPLENSVDGKLVGFRSLIMKYELRIVMTCDIPTSVDGDITRYALVRRRLPAIPDDRRRLRFEFNITPDAATLTVPELLIAARCCSLPVLGIDTLPRVHSHGEASFDITLSASGGIHTFLCFLALEAPGFEPLGLYRHIGDAD